MHVGHKLLKQPEITKQPEYECISVIALVLPQ